MGGGNLEGEKQSILLVDDNEAFIDVLAKWLTVKGFQVRSFAGAQAGLQEYFSHPDEYFVALLDLQMSGLDGLGMIKQIRGHASESVRNIPAIAMTGCASESCGEGLFDAVLRKPFQLDEVFSEIIQIMKRKAFQ